MTHDIQTQADLFEQETEDARSLSDDGDDRFEPSPTSSVDYDEQGGQESYGDPNDELPAELCEQLDECLQFAEAKQANELQTFIEHAREQGCNCLDLSKKSIAQFPVSLLDFPSLDVSPRVHDLSAKLLPSSHGSTCI